MQNMIGSAGMRRGWAAIWSMEMLWLFATLSLCVAAAAAVELVMSARARAAVPLVSIAAAGEREQPGD